MVAWLGQHMAIFLQWVPFYSVGEISILIQVALITIIFEISTFWIDVLQWAEGVVFVRWND